MDELRQWSCVKLTPTFTGLCRRALWCFFAALSIAGCSHARPGRALNLPDVAALPSARSSHVVIIVLENEESTDVLDSPDAPYTNSLIRRYGLATQSFAITHRSLPNYLALTSGSTQDVTSDCTSCTARGPNIVDELEAAGIAWRAYLEDVPSPCYRGAAAGAYAKKHNPFAYYDDISHNSRRCENLVGFAQLARDLRLGRLPTYVWVSPNLCDDGHDCGVAGSDRFLARTAPALLHELGPHGFLVLTWDEGDSDSGCCAGIAQGGHVVSVLAGPEVRPGSREARPIDHYGTLATIEEALGLPLLGGAADPRSGRLNALFRRPPHIR